MAIPSSPAYHWSIDYAVRYLAKVRGLTLDHAIDDFQRAIERGELPLSGAFYDKTGTLVRYVVKISYFRSVLYVGIKDGRVTVIHRGGIIGDPNIGNTAHSVPSSRVKRLWPQPATASTRKRKPATMLLRVASAFKEIYGPKGPPPGTALFEAHKAVAIWAKNSNLAVPSIRTVGRLMKK